MTRFFIAVASLLLLTACEPTVEDYVEDAKLRKAKIEECAQMGMIAAQEDKFCTMAMEAQGIAMRNAAGNLMNAITMQPEEK